MSGWGLELWDQEKVIFSHTDQSLHFVGKCQSFMQALAHAEMSYAKEIRKLCKSHASEVNKMASEHPGSSSLIKAWKVTISETDDMAKQHEVIAENITSKITEPMKVLAKERRAERQCHISDCNQLQTSMASTKKKYEAAKKAFDKANKVAVDAHAAFLKADADSNTTRQKIDKIKAEKRRAEDERDSVKGDYTIVSEEMNRIQRKHLSESQAGVFNAMQAMEENIIQSHAYYLGQYGHVVGDVFGILNTCLDNIANAAAEVDAASDTAAFAAVTKSGLPIPDLSAPTADVGSPAPVSAKTVQQINQKRVTKHKFFKTTSRKKDAVREDFGHLPPEQRKNAIKAKLAELNDQKAKADKTIAGLSKTVELYTDRPEMGDEKFLAAAKKELKEQQTHMATLEADLYKFGLYLSAIEGTPPPDMPSPSPSRRSIGSRASVGSMSQAAAAAPASTPAVSEAPVEETPEEEQEFDGFGGDDGNTSGLSPVIGSASALYSFAGTNDGELPINQGDVLDVHEDDGSGWVRVSKDGVEGYVPASYVEIQ